MSFRLKTVLGIATIEAALLAFLVWSSLTTLHETGENQLLQRARTTAKLFSTTTADAVLTSDLASLETHVEELLQNPGLAYARVSNTRQILAEGGDEGALRRPFRPDTDLASVDDGIFDAAAKIAIGGDTYGSVEIGLDIDHLQQQLQRATRTFSGIAIAELALSALFSLVLGTLLTRHLGLLIEGTRAVREGRFGHQVAVHGRDELAQAAHAFNRMSSDLATLMQENRLQQDALRENSALLSGLIDNLGIGILMADMHGKVLHVNRGFTDLFDADRAPSQLIGSPLGQLASQICRRDDADTSGGAIGQLLRTRTEIRNQVTALADGRVLETDYLPLIAEGAQYAHLWTLRDVTERERSRQLIEERRRQLDTVFELSPDGFVYFDSDGLVSSVNPAFERLTGIGAAQAGGVHRSRFFALVREACGVTDIDDSSGKRVIRISRPAARILVIDERQLRDDKGEGTAQVMYLRDITHETELDEMKSDFLATAAHELRTPLSSVYGYAELLLEFEQPPDVQREMLQTIHSQADHLVSMLNELLDLARIEARQGKDFDIHQQPLLPVLQDIATAFLPPQRDRSLTVDLPDTLPPVALDSNKTRQMLNNILNNAFKYSPAGGEVRLSASETEDDVVVAVRDQGMGMTPQQVACIFDRFYRADKSGQIPGSGLGMALVREITDIHGWRIDIRSQPDKGTRVAIHMPKRRHFSSTQ